MRSPHLLLALPLLLTACKGDKSETTVSLRRPVPVVQQGSPGQLSTHRVDTFELASPVDGTLHVRTLNSGPSYSLPPEFGTISLDVTADEPVQFSLTATTSTGDAVLSKYVAPMGGWQATEAVEKAVPSFRSRQLVDYTLASVGESGPQARSTWQVPLERGFSSSSWHGHDSSKGRKLPVSENILLSSKSGTDSSGHLAVVSLKKGKVSIQGGPPSSFEGDLFVLWLEFEPSK